VFLVLSGEFAAVDAVDFASESLALVADRENLCFRITDFEGFAADVLLLEFLFVVVRHVFGALEVHADVGVQDADRYIGFCFRDVNFVVGALVVHDDDVLLGQTLLVGECLLQDGFGVFTTLDEFGQMRADLDELAFGQSALANFHFASVGDAQLFEHKLGGQHHLAFVPPVGHAHVRVQVVLHVADVEQLRTDRLNVYQLFKDALRQNHFVRS